MGSKTKTTTTHNTQQSSTQKRDPWQPAQPYILDTLNSARDLYNSDAGTNLYPNKTYVGPSDTTRMAMEGITNKAMNNDLTAAAQGNLMDYVQGGFEGPANDFYRNAMNGGMNVDGSRYDKFFNSSSGPGDAALNSMMNSSYNPTNSTSGGMFDKFMQGSNNPANEYFSNIASGNNPYLDKTFDHAADKISDRVNSNFSKAGRYGSAAHQDKLTADLGQFANDFYGNQYNTDQNRRMSAAGALSNDYNTNLGQQMSATNAKAGIEQNDLSRNFQGDQASRNRAYNAANSLNSNYLNNMNLGFNAANAQTNIDASNIANRFSGANYLDASSRDMDNKQLQAIGMAPGLNAADYNDYNQMLRVGGLQEQYDAKALQDDMNRFNFNEQNPYNRLAQYANLSFGYGGLGGTGTSSGTSSGTQNTVQSTGGLGPTFGNIMGGIGMAMPFMPIGGGSSPALSASLPQGVNSGAYGYQNGQYWS